MCMLWIQSMPSMPYSSMQMPVGWNGLSMPTCPLRNVLCTCPLSWLILRSGVLDMTLSHIWLRLYLATVLLSVELLTLMNVDSFTVLARPWSSLPMMLKLSWGAMPHLGDVHVDGWGFLQVLFESFSKDPGGLLYVFLITWEFPTLVVIYSSTLLVYGVLVFMFN